MVWPSGMMASVPNRSGPRHEHDAAHSRDGLGGLVGGGSSKVGAEGAMRARDVARPTAADLAAAERDLVIRYAAQRTDSRPLPEGIVPASPNPRSYPKPPARRPRPGPPHPSSDGQPPVGNGGSTPDCS